MLSVVELSRRQRVRKSNECNMGNEVCLYFRVCQANDTYRLVLLQFAQEEILINCVIDILMMILWMYGCIMMMIQCDVVINMDVEISYENTNHHVLTYIISSISSFFSQTL